MNKPNAITQALSQAITQQVDKFEKYRDEIIDKEIREVLVTNEIYTLAEATKRVEINQILNTYEYHIMLDGKCVSKFKFEVDLKNSNEVERYG